MVNLQSPSGQAAGSSSVVIIIESDITKLLAKSIIVSRSAPTATAAASTSTNYPATARRDGSASRAQAGLRRV